ncbi:F0F1 ATP synthase subunit B [bacterium SCSIO 12741]|nr:F0F1 ATP synthase subunit B [bacterium SCSIO 12741]
MNPLVTPDLGLMVWTTLVFLILMFLLAKFAWRPILNAVKDREDSIRDALQAADKAREEMSALSAQNEVLLKEARAERDVMLKEARETRDKIVSEAKGAAKEEADKMISSARDAIQTEKAAAMAEVKNQVTELALQVAEKVLREELSSEARQKQLANDLVAEIKLN